MRTLLQAKILLLLLCILNTTTISHQLYLSGNCNPTGTFILRCINATAVDLRGILFTQIVEKLECFQCNLGVIAAESFDNGFNRLQEIYLVNSNVTGLVPYSFIGLMYLKELVLSNNDLKVVLPGTFKGIRNILKLYLDSNQLREIETDTFAELINLEYLDMSKNRISEIFSGAFNNLNKLKVLSLENNRIVTVHESFTGLNSIEQLYLKNNFLTESILTQFNISNLLKLDISANNISTIQTNSFSILNKLKDLKLNNNNISKLETYSFRGLRFLEYVNLANNSIETINLKTFVQLNKLTTIDLSYNKLKTFQFAVYSSIPELAYINLTHNRIENIRPGKVLKLYKLNVIDISYNNINDLDYKQLLLHAPKIVVLHIDNNNLPCYIVNEMISYFVADEIMLSIEAFNKSCEPTKQVDFLHELKEMEKMVPTPLRTREFFLLYTLTFLIAAIICVLGYFQYRTYSYLKNFGTSTISLLDFDNFLSYR